MDPKKLDSILQQLYRDKTFAVLKQPRDLFNHILDKYLHLQATKDDHDCKSKVRQLLTDVDERLKEWNNVHNRKSYKLAKKLRESARKMVQMMSGANSVMTGLVAPDELDEDQRDYLHRGELYYSKAIMAVPYASAEHIDRNIDKVARLKVRLYQERAEVRFRVGKFEQAGLDVAVALHHADQIAEQYKGYEQLKTIAVKCFGELKIIEPNEVNNLLEYVGNAQISYSSGSEGDDDHEEKQDSLLIARHQARDSLNNMIEYNGFVSNYNPDNAPQLFSDEQEQEGYFRYQLAEDLVQVRNTPGKGRHMVARNDITTGTWIMVEKPYSTIVQKDFLAKKCNLCLKDLTSDKDSDGKGYPCDYCKEAQFCCVNCFEEAYQTYHRYECGILGFLLAGNCLSAVHVFRSVSQVGLHKAIQRKRGQEVASASGDFALEDFLAKKDLRTKGAFELTDEDRFALYDMSSSLVEHSDKYDATINAYHAMHALNIVLVMLTKEKNILESDVAKHSVGEMLLDLLQLCYVSIRRVTINVFGQFDYEPNGKKNTVATAQILIGSLINHSCVPNVEWQFKSGHILFRASRPIARNEELAITYGQTRAIPFLQRQDALQHYHFLCSCTLCRADIASLPEVVRCQRCQDGPLVVARNNAACLHCNATASATAVKSALAEIKKNRQLLQWYHKMVLASSSYSSNVETSDPARYGTSNLKKSTLSVASQIEACLREMAYRGTTGFTVSLHELADIYLHLDELDRAMELAKLYEQSECTIEAATLLDSARKSRSEIENKMMELNFWTETCQAYFEKVMANGRDIDDDSALQVAILVNVRFLKVATDYVAERIGPTQIDKLTVSELLNRSTFNDAKLAFILANKKKASLMTILEYAKSRCN